MSEPIHQRLAKAVQDVGSITKSKIADTGKYQYAYADLTDVLVVVKNALQIHSLAMVQPIVHLSDGFAQVVTTILSTTDDQPPIELPGAPFKVMNDPQATGSAITYARRYSLTTLFALETQDDDGAMAKRAAINPHERTEAEKQVRQMIAGLPDAMAKEDFQAAFIEHFGCTLTNLPESRHGDALGFAKEYLK